MTHPIPAEWDHEQRRAIAFHTGRKDGRTFAVIRETAKGVSFQCEGYAAAPLHSMRFKNAESVQAAMDICEVRTRRLRVKPLVKRRQSLIGRNLQTDRESVLDESEDSWAC